MYAGQTIADRYVIEAILGQGGTATVYRVRHAQLDSTHVVKVLDLTSKSIRKRLLQEGRIQASLRHPNIVTVTDVIEVDGHPALVMEFVDGPSLADLLAKERPAFDVAEAWFRDTLGAVSYAHKRGLVHRDIKPDNILMAPFEGGYIPKVADFGIAKVLGEYFADRTQPGTRAGLTLGTPAYMPPEQANDAAGVDQRADVFALGCVLYELFCGQRAFPGDNMLSVLGAIVRGAYTPPRDIEPGVPGHVEAAIRAALVPDVEKRAPDCAALLALLNGAAAEEPPPPEPVPPAPTPDPRPVAPPPSPAPPRGGMGLPIFALVVAVVALLIALLAVTGSLLLSGGAVAVLALSGVEVDTGGIVDIEDFALEELEGLEEPDEVLVGERVERVEAAHAPEWRIEVHRYRTESSVRNGVMKHSSEVPGGRLYIVDVSVQNLAEEEVDPGFPWSMVGPDGTEYDASLGCHMALKGSLSPTDSFGPREKREGSLCFDGPASAKGLRVVFETTFSGGDPRREFPL